MNDTVHEYSEGQKIRYHSSFGNGPLLEARIIGAGQKNNKPVYDLDNGTWCYEYQILGTAYALCIV